LGFRDTILLRGAFPEQEVFKIFFDPKWTIASLFEHIGGHQREVFLDLTKTRDAIRNEVGGSADRFDTKQAIKALETLKGHLNEFIKVL